MKLWKSQESFNSTGVPKTPSLEKRQKTQITQATVSRYKNSDKTKMRSYRQFILEHNRNTSSGFNLSIQTHMSNQLEFPTDAFLIGNGGIGDYPWFGFRRF